MYICASDASISRHLEAFDVNLIRDLIEMSRDGSEGGSGGGTKGLPTQIKILSKRAEFKIEIQTKSNAS